MESTFIECGHVCINKHGETLCGDSYCILKGRDRMTVVLSDGLGSGVKANILSTLTAKILSTLVARGLSLDECVQTVATTLPMCRERKLAYATFSVMQLDGGQVCLWQYDNPAVILLRGGKSVKYPLQVRFIGEKEIHESRFTIEEGDMLVAMTDGVTNAGVGKLLEGGLNRDEVAALLERWYTPDITPQRAAAIIAEACMSVCMDSPDDDITALVLKVKRRQAVNVIIGPPQNPDDDDKVLKLFFAKEGKHVVCGGTTAATVSRYLSKPIVPLADSGSETVPAMASIEGVDLVTEGVITLQKVTELAEQYTRDSLVSLTIDKRQDGVSLLAQLLLEQATDINIYQGMANNHAHEEMDIDFGVKVRLVEKLERLLAQMGKNVKVSRC